MRRVLVMNEDESTIPTLATDIARYSCL